MHLTLHPSDAALVIAQGWGERHPLAGRLIFGKPLLPAGFVMVYAPQDESQVGLLLEIVRAGAWWVGGIGLGKGQRGVGVLTQGERWVKPNPNERSCPVVEIGIPKLIGEPIYPHLLPETLTN